EITACLSVSVAVGTVAIMLIGLPAKPAPPRFILDRNHAADASARRCLVAIALHALAVAVAVGRALEYPPQPGDATAFPRVLFNFGLCYTIGVSLSVLQKYPQRAAGLLPYAMLIVTIGLIAAWIAPAAEWPVAVIAVGTGLAHAGPRAWLMLLVPDAQRGGADLGAALGAIAGAALGVGLPRSLSPAALPPVRVALAVALCIAAFRFFFRELFEQSLEFFLWIFYPVRGY